MGEPRPIVEVIVLRPAVVRVTGAGLIGQVVRTWPAAVVIGGPVNEATVVKVPVPAVAPAVMVMDVMVVAEMGVMVVMVMVMAVVMVMGVMMTVMVVVVMMMVMVAVMMVAVMVPAVTTGKCPLSQDPPEEQGGHHGHEQE